MGVITEWKVFEEEKLSRFPSPTEVTGVSYFKTVDQAIDGAKFPYPLEVNGGYYQRVILRMRKTTLCFRTLPR